SADDAGNTNHTAPAGPDPVEPTPSPADYRDRLDRETYREERPADREPIRVRDRGERESGLPVRERLSRVRDARDHPAASRDPGPGPGREPAPAGERPRDNANDAPPLARDRDRDRDRGRDLDGPPLARDRYRDEAPARFERERDRDPAPDVGAPAGPYLEGLP